MGASTEISFNPLPPPKRGETFSPNAVVAWAEFQSTPPPKRGETLLAVRSSLAAS